MKEKMLREICVKSEGFKKIKYRAKKYNKACIELYDRLVEKGKPKKVALIAVVNKLLKQAFALATKNEFYLEIN